jgi:Lrp/AsnC family leucine-responsive transcriptional regulator
MPQAITLDRIDRNILMLLQADNQITNLQLADQVGLSPAACLRRVRLLMKNAVIEANIAVVNPVLAGMAVTVIVELTLVRAAYEMVAAFKARMRDHPAVSQCYLVTGEADFVIVVQVPTMDEYELFLQNNLYNNPVIDTMTSMVVVSRVKFEPRIDLRQAD